MSPEDRILFACTRQEFTPAHAGAVQAICRQPVRWECVLATALEQSVAPLVFTNLLKTQLEPALPPDVAGKFSRQLWENLAVKAKMARVLAQVLERFPHEDLLLVKSAALDRSVYDQPWYLWSYDVDVLFRRRRDQFDPAELAGLVAFLDKANLSIRSMDQHFEYEFFEHHDLCLNGILPVDFERVWRGAARLATGVGAVFIPSPEDSLLFACINACRKRYFYLKVLCDIAEIINKYPALDWSMFAHNARAYRCNLIAYASLRLAQRTLAAKVPAAALAQLDVSAPRQWLIELLLGTLCRLGSLTALSRQRGTELFARRLGWSLALTYSTYHWDQLAPKLWEIPTTWRQNASLRARGA